MKKFFAILIFGILLLTGCVDGVSTSEHLYAETVIEPTCEEAGYTEYKCIYCDDAYVGNITPELGHVEQAVDAKEPGCTADGYTAGVKCARCEVLIVAPLKVEATGHSYTADVTAPSCKERGYTTYLCIACGDAYIDDYVSANGHSWREDSENALKICTVCNTSEKIVENDGDEGAALPVLTVTYVDVGQGDCIFIKLGDCDILIDAGKPAYGKTVSDYLKGKNVDDIELMIASHLDDDHYGGLTQVLADFEVEAFWGTGFKKSNSSITTLKNAVANEGLSIINPTVGTAFMYESMTITVIYDGVGATNSNDSSLVVMLEYGSHSFLFTGDISSKIESKILDNGVDVGCDVLKVAHHGSKGSSSSAFLNATGAKYGVICVGTGNSYGHPTSAALNNLASAGIAVYRTDLSGHVVFTTDGVELTTPNGSGRSAEPIAAESASVMIIYNIDQISEALRKRYLLSVTCN